jgi:hypothetical protein
MSFLFDNGRIYAGKAEPNDEWIFSLALFLFYLSFGVHIEHEEDVLSQYIDGEINLLETLD